MESNEGFDRETLSGGSFSELLDSGNVLVLDAEESFSCPSSFSTGNLPKMFCFENVCNELERGYNEAGMVVVAAQKSGCRGSVSSNSSSNSFSNLQKSQSGDAKSEQKWLNESVTVSGTFLGSDTGATAENRQTCKRTKKENPASSTGLIKVRKEKLGERITALQQLVSPFGKTDTASVLHEAMGYIRFLHDQVQVLSSPYLQRLPSSAAHEGRENEEDELRYDLRSRGLCLVPAACTAQVENSINGADFWSPAMRGNSSSKH